MILVAGSILSWFKIAAIDLVFEAAAFGIAEIVLCLTAVYGLLSSKDKKWAFFIPAAGAAVLTFIRPVQILNGFLSFLNICIYSWNENMKMECVCLEMYRQQSRICFYTVWSFF